jgi:fatty acid desaturase
MCADAALWNRIFKESRAMKIWKYTPRDAAMVILSVAQFATTFVLAAIWQRSSVAMRLGGGALLVVMMTYSIIVVTHLFTHTPWFESASLNSLASMLNSMNIGQSAQAYQLTHVRNHHRYNNDQKGPDGNTNDISSTYQDGVNDEHATLFHYAFVGAISTLVDVGRALASVFRLWRVGERERKLLELAAKVPERRSRELRQIQLDRMAHFLGISILLLISWKWVLFCYLPAFYLALALVNVQNYYEHYGAEPDARYADSVSYYGRFYNLITFNDGYHQEHHLRPQAHWSSMPMVRREHREKLDKVERVVSPVPAIFGFLHRNRPQLHHRLPASKVSSGSEDSLSGAARGNS